VAWRLCWNVFFEGREALQQEFIHVLADVMY
jgi:hypothetical protein